MIDTIKDFVTGNVTTWLGIFAYWIPVAINLIADMIENVEEYRYDLSKSTEKYFKAELTIGRILGKIIRAFIPVVNFFWSLQYIFQYGEMLVVYIGKLLDIPLVRHKPNETK